jgi:tetratricopeptide (TPR) repeat protein
MTIDQPPAWSESDLDAELSPEESAKALGTIEHLVLFGLEHNVEPGDSVGFSQSYFDALQELAVRRYNSQRYDSAAAMYQRLLRLKPMQLAYYKGLGACCLGLQRYDAAVKVYHAARVIDALDAEVAYYLGLAYYFQKDFPAAFDLMRFARVHDENDPKPGSKIAAFATQLLDRMKPLVPPEQAARIDLRPH